LFTKIRDFTNSWCNKTAATVESTPPESPKTTFHHQLSSTLLPFLQQKLV
jgi:hypothetical protein